ncbi:class I SAM-dependent methyltransferase [Algoriphagus chordae]|uniref:Ubiquinone/menaquinone biosynthesis C-methylase UbiE n=1 Tax=Algoriphagus chordae TaxID=237019 RepID=A0A2W7RBS1_9BACT|nr:class I SAM-dependent methyltransferase [Algoriphagus chordae]PZX56586.1 ubiquinone/menaquinone biosynthesis C-methylase UbiE [Algoriphagus chordae]
MNKSSTAEIRARFENDVERFSNLDTGQVATIDATISLELITEAAKRIVPNASSILDVGCGAGNYSLMMLTKLPDLNCTLVDLSGKMLEKAVERVSAETDGKVAAFEGDIRDIFLPEGSYDIILAGAVLHHLREDSDWENTFAKLFKLLKPGGCLMISDLITQDTDLLNDYTWERYGDYLESIGGKEYREKVLAYVDKEDSPRSMNYQLDLMKQVGFSKVEILHKNMCFGAFGGIKEKAAQEISEADVTNRKIILDFLQEIGIPTKSQKLEKTFLPGIKIDKGILLYDPENLLYPGDLLHEAGHIALMTEEERKIIIGNVKEYRSPGQDDEMAVMLWSYAALKYLNLSPEVVFHPDGYKGDANMLIASYESADYKGLPLLVWMELCESSEFPKMRKWLRG